MMATKKVKEEKQETAFSKEQILASSKYANRRDVLGAILSNDGSYTFEKVDSLLDKFMKGKVK
jgi:hypothetical protein